MAAPVVNLYRNGAIESTHYGNLAIVDSQGNLKYYVGDPYARTFMRSSAKPLQAIQLVQSGGLTRFGLSLKHLAVICASHSGEQFHIQAISEILERIGLGYEALQCGIHEPLYYLYNNIKLPQDLKLNSLYHNCSGKHAGMLALCVHLGYPVDNYLEFEHPAQKLITQIIAEMCDLPEKEISLAIDGCSAPVHGMPIYNMALAYAKFSDPGSLPQALAESCRTIARAMTSFPEMVGGTKRYDTDLMKATGGKLISKVGAEGVHCAGWLDHGIGMACKITDGNRRASYPFSLEALFQSAMINSIEFEKMREYHTVRLKNYRELEVGVLKPEFTLLKAN